MNRALLLALILTACGQSPQRAPLSPDQQAPPGMSAPQAMALEASRAARQPPVPQVPETLTPLTAEDTALLDAMSIDVSEVVELRARVVTQASEIGRLRLALDECQNPDQSVLGSLRLLPEWKDLSERERETVRTFLRQFPVMLTDGEAGYVARYAANPTTGAWTKEVIAHLGPQRVLNAMDADARKALFGNDREEFDELFPGTRMPE